MRDGCRILIANWGRSFEGCWYPCYAAPPSSDRHFRSEISTQFWTANDEYKNFEERLLQINTHTLNAGVTFHQRRFLAAEITRVPAWTDNTPNNWNMVTSHTRKFYGTLKASYDPTLKRWCHFNSAFMLSACTAKVNIKNFSQRVLEEKQKIFIRL